MLGAENSYGLLKRLRCASDLIHRHRPRRVLDVGCGTGQQLTEPLAQAFPEVAFDAVDADAGTILKARERSRLTNLRFLLDEELDLDNRYDLVIASEVVEHVTDPVAFLTWLRQRLAGNGRILMTLPNGYGPFELVTFFDSLLGISRLLTWLRADGRRAATAPAVDTHAVSPHINFFSRGAILRVVRAAGLRESAYRGRTLLCGLGFDIVIRHPALIRWNAAVADRLPAWMVSDWMMVLEPGAVTVPFEYRRGWCARMRRRLNETRAGLR